MVTKRQADEATLRELAMLGAIRRKDRENAELVKKIYEYEQSRKRWWAATFAKYDRMIAEEKAAQEAHDEKISLIMQGIALFLAGAGCMATYMYFIVKCLGG